MANEQSWQRYVKDDVLEHYISIFEGMLERYTEKSYGPAYLESVRASLARLEAEYERRASV